jgi:hypothetical protein
VSHIWFVRPTLLFVGVEKARSGWLSGWSRCLPRKWPGFDSRSRPDLRLSGKVALFCNPASGGTFSSTAIEIIKWVYIFAVAQAKVSHILRPGNTALKKQLKLVNGFER